MVFSADCIILLLFDPVTRSIGAVHAGWRGTALDLPAKTAAEMARLFGARRKISGWPSGRASAHAALRPMPTFPTP